MKVIYCSNYLAQQERANRLAAEEALAPVEKPNGFWRRLLVLLFGPSRRERNERRKRQIAAQQHASEAESWAQGRRGEDLVAAVLGRRLDHRHLLLRNYTPPAPRDAGGDIDAVLLGPDGVTIFEVKAWRGSFRYEGADWWRWCGPRQGWQPAWSNPSEQAIANANRIRGALRQAGIDGMPVRPVVAVADPEMEVELSPPLSVFVFFACRRRLRLDFLDDWRDWREPLAETTLAKVYAALLSSVSSANANGNAR